MKKNSILALLIIVCMICALFTACGNTNGKETPSNEPTQKVSDEASGGTTPDAEDIVNIEFWIVDNGNIPKLDLIQDAMNEITEENLGIHVNITSIATADYGAQVNLAIANGETVDVALYTPAPASSWMTLYSGSSMLDISSLLDEHGKELKELMGTELINATRVGEAVYGLSNYRLLNSQFYFYYRTDVLEATGTLELFQNMDSWSEYEQILQAIKADGDIYPTGGDANQAVIYMGFEFSGDSFSTNSTWDMLGDSMGLIWSDQAGNVESATERANMVNMFKMLADWNGKGYIWPDSAFNINNPPAALIGQNVFAGGTCLSEFGAEAIKTQQCGVPMSVRSAADYYIATQNCQFFGMYIPVTSSEPEAAMRFLNALYTTPEMMNTICWGIENETYVVKDGIAGYLEGKDVSTSGYHLDDFRLGNQFLCLPWEGSAGGADYRNQALENFLAAKKSAYMGLTVDLSDASSLVAAITSVRGEYHPQMYNGMYTEALYNEYISKLKSAGIDDYVAIYQNAVSEFMK